MVNFDDFLKEQLERPEIKREWDALESEFSEFNPETIAAMEEAEKIARGEIPTKVYGSVQELFDELDAEIKAEQK